MKSLRNYQGYEHVLTAQPFFVHPVDGSVWFAAIEKQASGVHQNLAIYRMARGSIDPVLVRTWTGGVDAQGPFAPGGVVIDKDGRLIAGASLQILGHQGVTVTGFEGGFGAIPGFAPPW